MTHELLPEELLELCLACLEPADLFHAARVCARWAAVVRGESLWRQLWLRHRSPTAMEALEKPHLGWREGYRAEVHCRFDRRCKRAGDDYDCLVKTVLIGDSGVGKTAFLQRFTDDEFPPYFHRTIGIDFKIKNVSLRGTRLKLQMWDVGGSPRYRNVTGACCTPLQSPADPRTLRFPTCALRCDRPWHQGRLRVLRRDESCQL